MHCLICSELQAPGDISFYRRGKQQNIYLSCFFLFFFSIIIPHLIGGVYGGASTIRARLLPFLGLEQSYLNGLLSSSASDLYPLAWWRYPYSHLHTDAEFRLLADEYDRNLRELELDLSHANVDNARLESEYKKSDDLSFIFYQKCLFFL